MKSRRKEEKELSIIIVNYNARSYLLKTLESIQRSLTDVNYEVVVVDNASDDGSLENVKKLWPSVKRIALRYNVGFAKANNEGVWHASGRYLLILNNDTYVPKGTIEKLIKIKKSYSQYGIVAPLILNPDRSIQLSFGKDLHLFSEMFLKFFAKVWYRVYFELKKGRVNRNVDWVSGACFMIERSLYEQINGFDENFFLYIEDADLGRRVRQLGYKIFISSDCRIIHYLGQSTSKYPGQALLEAKKSQLYYYCKYNSRLAVEVLRNYLLMRFRFRHLISSLKGDSEGCKIWKKGLRIIEEFNCEDYS